MIHFATFTFKTPMFGFPINASVCKCRNNFARNTKMFLKVWERNPLRTTRDGITNTRK